METPKSRTKFASSISEMAKENGFDGVDLAWQFPVVTEKKEKNTWGKLHMINNYIILYIVDSFNKYHVLE